MPMNIQIGQFTCELLYRASPNPNISQLLVQISNPDARVMHCTPET